ncbi:MAG: polysaccharide export protein [Pseudomonadota bacterium]
MVTRLIILCCSALLAGCSLSPGLFIQEGQFEQVEAPEVEASPVSLIPITYETIKQQYQQRAALVPGRGVDISFDNYQYLVGPQDVLNIIVWEHPELTIPAGGQRPVEHDGNRVRADGTIFYPYVGVLSVVGKTTATIREELTKRLSRYIKKPQLDVRVVAFNSQKVHVAGAVMKPGSVPVTDIPLTLGDVVNAAGGINENADIQEVILTRDGRNISYNLLDLYYKGDLSQNILLQDKDIVYVPVNTMRKVFVMGEVSKPAAMPMQDGKLSLADVMATAGIDQKSADPEQIFVLRQGVDKPMAYQLDARQPGALILATAFELQPLDVVFVSTSGLSRWNRVMTQLMPTVQTLWTIDRISAGE